MSVWKEISFNFKSFPPTLVTNVGVLRESCVPLRWTENLSYVSYSRDGTIRTLANRTIQELRAQRTRRSHRPYSRTNPTLDTNLSYSAGHSNATCLIGCRNGNLRELALARMKDFGTHCRDIRTREVGIREVHDGKVELNAVELIRRDYSRTEVGKRFYHTRM